MDNYIDNDLEVKKEVRKAKRIIISFFLLIFVICPLVTYAIYDGIFPKAKELEYPDYSLIESITVLEHGEQIYLSDEEYSVLYEYIRTAKPTRIMSTNETPGITPFFTVEINTIDNSIDTFGYIYQQNEKFYFEIPYIGVYRFQIER